MKPHSVEPSVVDGYIRPAKGAFAARTPRPPLPKLGGNATASRTAMNPLG